MMATTWYFNKCFILLTVWRDEWTAKLTVTAVESENLTTFTQVSTDSVLLFILWMFIAFTLLFQLVWNSFIYSFNVDKVLRFKTFIHINEQKRYAHTHTLAKKTLCNAINVILIQKKKSKFQSREWTLI